MWVWQQCGPGVMGVVAVCARSGGDGGGLDDRRTTRPGREVVTTTVVAVWART